MGFKKHVSEVFFVIYTRAWAPKFILPHTEPAREVVRPGYNASSGKQNDPCVSSVVMVKSGGSKWPLLCICGLVFAFALAGSQWLILLFSIWRALWWKCRTITPSLREAPGSCWSKRNCWFHFFSKPPIGDRTACRHTQRQLKPLFRKEKYRLEQTACICIKGFFLGGGGGGCSGAEEERGRYDIMSVPSI